MATRPISRPALTRCKDETLLRYLILSQLKEHYHRHFRSHANLFPGFASIVYAVDIGLDSPAIFSPFEK